MDNRVIAAGTGIGTTTTTARHFLPGVAPAPAVAGVGATAPMAPALTSSQNNAARGHDRMHLFEEHAAANADDEGLEDAYQGPASLSPAPPQHPLPPLLPAPWLGPPPVPRLELPPENRPAAIKKRRAGIACRRCRRMRSKCRHDKGKSPCEACRDAGLGASECIFPERGQPDMDREFRHPRARAELVKGHVRRVTMNASTPERQDLLPQPKVLKGVDPWDCLPPLHEVIQAVNKFTHRYFQLGFIPKDIFVEKLRTDARSVNTFLLLGILSISARLTPCLVSRHGSAVKASELFMERASQMAKDVIYLEPPTLERCQAFYLLGVAQQGSGYRAKSAINMGIAIRLATLMQLHREETYTLLNPTPELIVKAESARRTLWMLHSQDNLHSGPLSPISLSSGDITTLLPCSEEDFAEIREPASRAALSGTPPAIRNPELIADSGRSLFAALIQAHDFWGAIARRAVNHDKSEHPWDPDSEYAKTVRALDDWERGLQLKFVWDPQLLRDYKEEGQELAYMGVTMVARLCNVVLRKAYLYDIINAVREDGKRDPNTIFWKEMSYQLFDSVQLLADQILAYNSDRGPEEGMGAQMATFCVYTCGFLASYLCKYPKICKSTKIVRQAPVVVRSMLAILNECKDVWPLSKRWCDHLEKFFKDGKAAGEGSMADNHKNYPSLLQPPPNSLVKSEGDDTEISSMLSVARRIGDQSPVLPSPVQPGIPPGPPIPDMSLSPSSSGSSSPVLPHAKRAKNIDTALHLPQPQPQRPFHTGSGSTTPINTQLEHHLPALRQSAPNLHIAAADNVAREPLDIEPTRRVTDSVGNGVDMLIRAASNFGDAHHVPTTASYEPQGSDVMMQNYYLAAASSADVPAQAYCGSPVMTPPDAPMSAHHLEGSPAQPAPMQGYYPSTSPTVMQNYYPAAPLAGHDGYEHNLLNYLESGAPRSVNQWAFSGSTYGGFTG